MIYGVVSDIHANDWSVFSQINSDGVNSRLRTTLDELLRAAKAVAAAGGDLLICAGDIFHTRGKLDPEVLNPTRQVFKQIIDMGIDILAIPGNHDLKSKDSQELSSTIQNLADDNVMIFNKVGAIRRGDAVFGFVPWRWSQEALLEDLAELAKRPEAAEMDVFIHAGIDGVISGMPGSGLTDDVLGKFGFRHVFAGHYHNHKVMQHGVISIGATTHHTWGDVGAKAGFLLVESDTGAVTFNDTLAPKFIDITGMDEDEMEIETRGSYVRFRGPSMTQTEINEFRDQLKKWGALGTSFEVPRTVVSARSAAPVKGLSLEQSVENFVDAKTDIPAHIDKARLKLRAREVLDLSRAVVAAA